MATRLVVLQKFFGRKEGQSLKEFSDEVGQLSEDEKQELAELAAEELGVPLDPPKHG